jgi:hypothetical protein
MLSVNMKIFNTNRIHLCYKLRHGSVETAYCFVYVGPVQKNRINAKRAMYFVEWSKKVLGIIMGNVSNVNVSHCFW